MRVWLKNEDIPGLAMSRSFGDGMAARVGVNAIPEIEEFMLEAQDKILVLASDGVHLIIFKFCLGIPKGPRCCQYSLPILPAEEC